MKNQNDMIVMIVTAVLAIGTLAAFYFTKPIPVQPAPPETVVVAPPQLPTGDVVMANALPNASGSGSGAGRGAGGAPSGIGSRGGGGGAVPFGSTPSATGAAGG